MSPRRSLASSLAAVLVLAPAARSSDPLITIGRETPVFITASATVRLDDNIGLSANDRRSDTIFVLSPGLDLQFSGASMRFALSASEQFIRYDSDSRLDSELTSVAGEFAYVGARSRAIAQASFRELDQTNLQLNSREQSVRRNMTNAGIDLGWNATAKSSIGSGFAFERTDYPAVGFIDSDVWSFPIDLYYAIRPKIDLSGGYRFRRSSLADGRGSSKDHYYNLGARGEFTSKLNGQVRVGFSVRDEDRGRKEEMIGVGASLMYGFSEKTTFNLNLSNDFGTSASGSSQEVFTVGVTGRFEPDPRWVLSAGLNFSSSDYLDFPRRQDDFFVGDIGATYLVSRSSSVNLQYVFRRNSSNIDPLNFDNNVLSLSSGIRF